MRNETLSWTLVLLVTSKLGSLFLSCFSVYCLETDVLPCCVHRYKTVFFQSKCVDNLNFSSRQESSALLLSFV